ncbi:hypothetical protein VSU16_02920 [Cetobacterium somerae]|uniref:hypothetical protein n=1 Tax=Cetobacterium somerae TaxID=188913 RepID=UPI002E7B6E85|nr:hypothetical protein [Cetobacterium somerae]WVJ01693.1 hypothetical protein VSU16_02920 [Cetobacterium somerae]
MEAILISYIFGKICDTLISIGKKSIENDLEQEQEDAFIEIIKELCQIDEIFKNKEFFIELLNAGKSFDEIYEVLREAYPLEKEDRLEEKKKLVENTINQVIIKYPKFKDYLIIEAIQKISKKEDTRQILSYEKFIEEYIKNPLTTPINNKFLCDNEEEYIEQVKNSQIIVFTGESGVGKTKTAVEIGKKYSNKYNKNFKIIYYKGLGFDDELIEKFKNENIKYLLMIDDANRAYEIFEKIVRIYAKRIQSENIKIILTVRNYAKKLFEKYQHTFKYLEINLSNKNKQYIEKTLKEDYGIINKQYIENILFLSKENYRLALMIAKVCLEEEGFYFIKNLDQIYEKYFYKIISEIDILNDDEALKIIIAIIFLGTVDIENETQKNFMNKVLKINLETLKQYVDRLYEKEIINIYNERFLKMSDQVLATYLFYKLFFVKKIVKFNDFIDNILLENEELAKDIIYPIISTFYNEKVTEYLKNETSKYFLQNKLLSNQKKYIIYKFMYFIFSEEILSELYMHIVTDNNVDNYELEENILDFLQLIRGFEEEENIIKLYFLYLKKAPTKKELIIKSLENNYLYKKESYRHDYTQEYSIVKSLVKIDDTIEIKEIILKLLKKFLEIEISFSGVSLLKKNSFSFGRYIIQESKNIRELRNLIFSYLKVEYEKNILRENILKLLDEYTSFMRRDKINSKELIKNDFIKIKEIFSSFSNKNFEERIVVNKYYNFFKDMQVEVNLDLLKNTSDYQVILYNQIKKRYRESDEILFEILTNENSFELELKVLFQICKYIKNKNKNYRMYIYKLEKRLYETKDDIRYLSLINIVFSENNLKINLNVWYMIQRFGEKRTFDLIRNNDFKLKNNYLIKFYESLQSERLQIVEEKDLLKIFEIAEIDEIDFRFNIYIKIKDKYPDFIIKAIKILKERKEINLKNIDIYSCYSIEELVLIFKNDFELYKELYKVLYESDYDLLVLYSILEKELNFLEYYLENIYQLNYNGIDFKELYSKPLYKKIFKRIIEILLDNRDIYIMEDLGYNFFNNFEQEKPIITKILLDNINDETKLYRLFQIISKLDFEQKKYYYMYLIKNNIKLEILEKIELYSTQLSFVGSFIPIYENRINEYKEILSELNSFEFIGYKKIINLKIDELSIDKNFFEEREIYSE